MDHLSGVRIAVTRAAAQARELAVLLEQRGVLVPAAAYLVLHVWALLSSRRKGERER